MSRVLETNYLEGVEVNLEMMTTGKLSSRKRADVPPVTDSEMPSTSSATVSVYQAQQNSGKKDNNSQG